MTLRPGSIGEVVALGERGDGLHQPLEGAGRVVHAAGVHGDREALLLDVRPGGAGAAQHATAARARSVASPAGGRGDRMRCSVADQRSLPYWPKTNSSAPRSSIALPSASRSPMAIAWRAGRPVITATARTDLGELEQRARGRGVEACRLGVVDDRRQRAVEVEADDDAVEDVAYGVVVGARVVGGELHGSTQPRAAHVRGPCPSCTVAGGPRGQRGASAVRMTVSRSASSRRPPAPCA